MSMSSKTILVIDDEPEQRDLVRAILRPEAYTILEASDYNDALAVQAAHLGEIDLAMIDVSLPGRNGYELSKALLAIEPHLKALFVSGHAGAELCRFFGLQITDVHFLRKPVDPAELLGRVKFVLALADPLAGKASSAR
jgi:DNA-binding response OmpR family regulator